MPTISSGRSPVSKIDTSVGSERSRILLRPLVGQIHRPASGTLAALHNLRAIVLLGGVVRATALRSSIGRSVVDLPVSSGQTLLEHWRTHCIDVAQSVGLLGLPVRLVVDRGSDATSTEWIADPRVMLAVERDPVQYRGTGGVLADLGRSYEPGDFLLIGNAAQILRAPLFSLATELAAEHADVAMVSHGDGSPSGLMLARCSAFAEVPRVGFVDLKEQALPAIARRHTVRVVEHPSSVGLAIRTLADYIAALRRYHADRAGVPENVSDLEDWHARFSLIEDGAHVHPSARVHDSVVLRGGSVEENAVVVRSVVCADGRVPRGQMRVDQLVRVQRRRS
jgi:mannose-1-phosphate guanylyltransferase